MSSAFAVRLAYFLAGFALAASSANAQSPYPNKPVTLVVPAPAGSGADIIAREVGSRLSAVLGQPVIVDDRGGAAGMIGAAYVAKAKPDGYTILLGTVGTQSINQSIYRSVPYDPQKDLVPVTPVTTVSNILVVSPKLRVGNVAELIARAKSAHAPLTFSSPGSGTSSHMAAELFKNSTGLDLSHVPYKSGGQAMTDVISGQVDMIFYHIPAVMPFINSGQLKPLGITTAQRDPSVPTIPTIAEQGVPGYQVDAWMGIFAPTGTPAPVVQRLNSALKAVINSPELAARMREQGAHPLYSTPEQFQTYVNRETARWRALVEKSGIKADL